MKKQKTLCTSQRGFTLVEVSAIIALIAILASVIFVNLNAARMKSRDAKIIAMVDSMMTAAQANVNAAGSGGRNYAEWMKSYGSENIVGSDDCDSFSNPSYRATCNELYNTIGEDDKDICPDGSGVFCRLFIGNKIDASASSEARGSRFGIAVWLPGAKKIYCKGLNGRSSDVTYTKDPNALKGPSPTCSDWIFGCPGCPGDYQ